MNVPHYRSCVSSCTDCPADRVLRTGSFAPRFGLGKSVNPELAFVGQNPPQVPSRALYGAFMLHYDRPYEMSKNEGIARNILNVLKLAPKDVWATQAHKCSTPGNAEPRTNCPSKFLVPELEVIQPKALLFIGWGAFQGLSPKYSVPSHGVVGFPVTPIGNSRRWNVVTFLNVIVAPHISMVDRFLDGGSYILAIEAAYKHIKEYSGPSFIRPANEDNQFRD